MEYDYKDLISYLKVCNQDLQTLHRHLRSDKFFSEHEQLGDYYEKVGEILDAVIELGLSLGYEDVSIAVGIEKFGLLDERDYSTKEAFNNVYKEFNNVINIIENIKPNLTGFVVSKLEEFQYYFQIEANYKIKRMFQAK